jgi:phospholipid/cholesterol/gamma-HCH transport system substrate-binding protein
MVLAQMAVILVITVLVVGYAVTNLLGVKVTNRPFKMTVHLSTAGGIFSGAEVAYRGVMVGRVTGLRLGTDDVTLTLAVDHGNKIPDNAIAHVYDLSAVGEQYLDLVPTGPSTTYLHAGSEIKAEHTTTPLQVATVLYDLERFVDSINPADVTVIGKEGAAAVTGTGPQLQQLVTDATSLVSQLSATQGAAVDLLHNAATLLKSAAAHANDFDIFARAADQLTSTLASSAPTLDKFLQQAPSTTALIDELIRDNGSAVAVLLGNLATLSQIQVARVPGLKSLLVAVPLFGTLAPSVVHNGALLSAGDINFSQPVCPSGLPLTSPISGVRTPVQSVTCNQNILPRGAANAPRPSGQGAAGDSAAQTQIAGYDPASGMTMDSSGRMLRLGTDGGQFELFGPNAWETLLVAGSADGVR